MDPRPETDYLTTTQNKSKLFTDYVFTQMNLFLLAYHNIRFVCNFTNIAHAFFLHDTFRQKLIKLTVHRLSCAGEFAILCLSCSGGVCSSNDPSARSVAKLHLPSGICNIRAVVANNCDARSVAVFGAAL